MSIDPSQPAYVLPGPRPVRPPPRRFAGAALVILTLAIVVTLGLLILVFSAWRSVNPGYVGVVFDKVNHRVTTGVLEPGWAIINPFTQSIQEYPVTIQNYAMVQKGAEGTVSGDDSVKVQSSEGQQLNLDVVIQYQVKKEEAATLYQDWGGAPIEIVEDRVVRQYTRSMVPVVAAKYGWEEITASRRGDIAHEIATGLTEEFSRRHLNLVSFGIREVHLPQPLQDALNNKIQAQQQAEQQRYQLEQAKSQGRTGQGGGHRARQCPQSAGRRRSRGDHPPRPGPGGSQQPPGGEPDRRADSLPAVTALGWAIANLLGFDSDAAHRCEPAGDRDGDALGERSKDRHPAVQAANRSCNKESLL